MFDGGDDLRVGAMTRDRAHSDFLTCWPVNNAIIHIIRQVLARARQAYMYVAVCRRSTASCLVKIIFLSNYVRDILTRKLETLSERCRYTVICFSILLQS